MTRLFIFVLALILMIGTMGALDHGNIGFLQATIQLGISILVEWLALRKFYK